VKFAFGHGTFAEETGGDSAGVLHAVAKGEARGHGQAATDDCVTAIEIVVAAEKVHRAAAPAGTTVCLAEHLG